MIEQWTVSSETTDHVYNGFARIFARIFGFQELEKFLFCEQEPGNEEDRFAAPSSRSPAVEIFGYF